MNKAKETACGGEITWGLLQSLIDNCDKTKKSKLNKSLTKDQVITILQGAISDKDPSERPKTTRFNNRDKLTLTSNGMIAMNILIECG